MYINIRYLFYEICLSKKILCYLLKIFLICEYISKLHNELLAYENTLLHGKNDLDIKHALVLYLFQYCTKLSLIQKDLCITLQCSHFSSSQYCMDVGDSFTTFRDYWKRWKLLETLNRHFLLFLHPFKVILLFSYLSSWLPVNIFVKHMDYLDRTSK